MNKTSIIIIVILILVVVSFVGFRYFGSSMSPMKSNPPVNLVVPANTVIISGNSFNPGTLTTTVGQKITWTNNDSYAHTVTSDNGLFDSGNILAGSSFSYIFTKTGTYTYHCTIHPFMTAKVVVK